MKYTWQNSRKKYINDTDKYLGKKTQQKQHIIGSKRQFKRKKKDFLPRLTDSFHTLTETTTGPQSSHAVWTYSGKKSQEII